MPTSSIARDRCSGICKAVIRPGCAAVAAFMHDDHHQHRASYMDSCEDIMGHARAYTIQIKIRNARFEMWD